MPAPRRQLAPVAVLSNGDQEQQEDKVIRTGLDRYIDAVLASGQLGVAKPDPRAFAAACSRLTVPPEAAVYVGDRLDVDAVAASRAGLRGIWLNRGGSEARRRQAAATRLDGQMDVELKRRTDR